MDEFFPESTPVSNDCVSMSISDEIGSAPIRRGE